MLKTSTFLFIALLSGTIFWSCNDDLPKDTRFDKQVMVDGYADLITHSFNELGQAIDDLNTQIAAFNNQSSITEFETIQDQFLEVVLTFQAARLFDIGPIKANLYMSNMAQWPSKNAIILSSISGTEVITQSFVSNLGANQKGLYGIEFLLFQDQLNNQDIFELFTSDSNAEKRLAYLKYTAQEIKTIFTDMNALWLDTYKNEFSEALENGVSGAENRIYNQSVTVIDEVINYIRLANDAFDIDAIAPNEDNLILWNSQYTATAINHLIAAISTVYLNNTQPGLFDHLNFVNAKWEDGNLLADEIQDKLENAQSMLSNINNMESAILTNDANIESLEQELKDILVLYRADMASWLSLLLLVGDNDGD
ncbi:MAG: imelysin family protein [Chitinophagales bacterium]